MVLAYYGISRSQVEIATNLGLIEGVGVPASRVTRLTSSTLRATRKTGELTDLLTALESSVPPIIEVRTNQLPHWDEDTFHVVLLTGVEGNAAYISDPAFDIPVTVSVGNLLLAWDETDDYFTLIEQGK
jgi:hypothetical protein